MLEIMKAYAEAESRVEADPRSAAERRKVEGMERERTLQEQIINTGNEYKQQMLNYVDEVDYLSVEINALKIRFEKASFYITGNDSTTPIAGNVNGQTCTNLNYAIENLNPKAAYFIIQKAMEEGWEEVTIRSLARPSAAAPGSGANSPHLVNNGARGIDLVSIRKNGVTVIFDNANYPNLAPNSLQKQLRDEIFNSLINDDRISQVLDPWELRSKNPVYSYQNQWQSGFPNGDITYSQYQNMFLHRNHLHITIRDY